ncbi:MAG TPA: DUF4388 domain-containing protein [Nitrospirota bacterium]|nr:DUF4388 domain-containing protein [Nitrospirota bacterium]
MTLLLSGNIRKTPLPDMLENLRSSKATGSLALQKGGVEKRIYVKEGRIIFASSTDPRDRLGDSLVRAGKLSRANLEQALVLYKKSAGLKKMGAILVENGFVPPKELFNGLKIQVKDIIFSLLLWEEGAFVFEERLPVDVIQLQINIQELIAELITRIKKEP